MADLDHVDPQIEVALRMLHPRSADADHYPLAVPVGARHDLCNGLAHGGVLGGAIYLMGGFTGTPPYLNDVWRSTDGATWTQVTNTTDPRFPGRLAPASVVLPGSGAGGTDELYYIGGSPNTGTPQNVYKSGDGTTWTQVNSRKNLFSMARI